MSDQESVESSNNDTDIIDLTLKKPLLTEEQKCQMTYCLTPKEYNIINVGDEIETEVIEVISGNEEDPIRISEGNKNDCEKSENVVVIVDDTVAMEGEFIGSKEELGIISNTSNVSNKPKITINKILDENIPEELCHQCNMVKTCAYKVDNVSKPIYLCDDTCLLSFQTLNKSNMCLTLNENSEKILQIMKTFVRKCGECSEVLKFDKHILWWETMEFCNEHCLSRYQNKIGSHCANCKQSVIKNHVGKYCVRFGDEIRQFCCNACLNLYKIVMKFCSYCQKSMLEKSENPLTVIEDSGQKRNFCSHFCLEAFARVSKSSNSLNIAVPEDISRCAVCEFLKPAEVVFEQQRRGIKNTYKFCCSTCFIAFRFINSSHSLQCDMCKIYFENDNCTEFSMYYENFVKNFCSKICQNIYIVAQRKIVSCNWCQVKKYNFDMIKKYSNSGQTFICCCLNCLTLLQHSAKDNPKKLKCDYCLKICEVLYLLKMSDETTRNLCSELCMISFLGKFKKRPNILGHAATNPCNKIRKPAVTNYKRYVIVKSPPRPRMENKATLCKPISIDKATSCRMSCVSKETQTDDIKENVIIPVPIYVPAPLPLFKSVVPVPIQFPLPVPVPILIPTTRNQTPEIMNELNQFPKNQYEAELLMLAKMVAEDQTDNTASGSGNIEEVKPNMDWEEALVAGKEASTSEVEKVRSRKRTRQGASNLNISRPDKNMRLNYTLGMKVWKNWVQIKNAELKKLLCPVKLFNSNILQLTAEELNRSLCLFVKEVRKANGSEYAPDTIYYLCLCVQKYLFENGRTDNIFTESFYKDFTDCLDELAQKFSVLYDNSAFVVTRVEEEHLWESNLLGKHSPSTLLTTLVFFNTKYFRLSTVEEHMQLSFSRNVKFWDRKQNGESPILKFFVTEKILDCHPGKKKKCEQYENKEDPSRCPINLFDFYTSKCPESAKLRRDVFYLQPEPACAVDSPMWYSTMALGREEIHKILCRVKMIKEINIALLNA